jgi:hypothetical protein
MECGWPQGATDNIQGEREHSPDCAKLSDQSEEGSPVQWTVGISRPGAGPTGRGARRPSPVSIP